MEGQQYRGRSSSAGHQPNHIRHSPSPQHYHDYTTHLDLDPSINNTTFNTGPFNSNITTTTGPEPEFNLVPQSFYQGSPQPPQFQHHVLPSNDFADPDFGQKYHQDGLSSSVQSRSSQLNIHQSGDQYSSIPLSAAATATTFEDFDHQQKKQAQLLENDFPLEPQFQAGIQQQQVSINPADLMSNMSSPQNLMPTPPNMMSSDPNSPPGPVSLALDQNHHYSPNHSRQTSLDPSSAQFVHGQQGADWANVLGAQFQTHRRAPSEHSDVSSSVAPSPFLPTQESFDSYDGTPSPMLNAQQDHLYPDALGIEQFSLADGQQNQQQRISPAHSPFVSPRMSPHPGFGFSQDNFMLAQNNFGGGPGPEIYTSQAEDQYNHSRLGSGDMGQAASMAPPEINVELAPPSKQTLFEPHRLENDLDALSPPEGGKAPYIRGANNADIITGRRGRMRAKSETYLPRPGTPSSTLCSNDLGNRNRSLSPFEASFSTSVSPSGSRDPSPASRAGLRRSSTSSIPNRDYILELADPNRPPTAGPDRRIKHPANFQCTLCPKRFTRAYNLRSHLRTHTDERPFVCTVCGKAFARQHDRKRHEGLHTGEKKFVCRGELGAGGNWGCGRRFARADALGRHFRSEAGRICIKPLLDEEAMERQRLYDEHMMAQNQNHTMQQGGLMPAPPPSQNMNGGFTLPAALLVQYPALQGLQWDQLGQAGPDEGDVSGRSSFDASSGGEWLEDEGEEMGYGSGNGGGNGNGNGNGNGGGGFAGGGGYEWASDYEGR